MINLRMEGKLMLFSTTPILFDILPLFSNFILYFIRGDLACLHIDYLDFTQINLIILLI
jgi:hypothetical protein